MGRLTLKILEARLNRDTDWLGKMDCYVVIEHNGQRQQTVVHNEGGKNPVWNYELVFTITGINESMKLTIMDDDPGSHDEIVAECELKSSDLNIPPYRPSKTEP